MYYFAIVTSHKIRFYGLLFSFAFVVTTACAQAPNRFLIGAAIGPDVSFNRGESDKTLPQKMRVLQGRAGLSFDLFLEYMLTKRISLQGDVKLAARKTGFRYDDLETTPAAQEGVWGHKSGYAFIHNSPVHFNIGAKINSNLLRNRFILAAGAGFAYMVIRDNFAPPIGAGGSPDDKERLFILLVETRESNYGLLLNVNTSLSYRVGTDKFLVLTAAYNHGLVKVYKQQSQQFDFVTPVKGESYQLSIFNKGSYAALQLGYKLPLYNLPLLKKRR